MALDLVFRRALYSGGPVDLVFGGGGGEPPALPLTADITLALGGPVVAMTAIYDNRLPWRVSARTQVRHQSATPAERSHTAGWAKPDAIDNHAAERWQSAADAAATARARWQATRPMPVQAAERWQAGTRVGAVSRAVHQVCTPMEVWAAIGWQAATLADQARLMRHQVATPAALRPLVAFAQARNADQVRLTRHQVATPALVRLLARWQEARPLPAGLSIYVPPGGGEGVGHVVDLNIVFACPPYEQGAPVELVFGHVCIPTAPELPQGLLYILPARYYMAVHSLTAARLPDNEAVTISGVSLSADKGSFDWSFTAQARREAIEQFAPVAGVRPAIQITLDGIAFVFTVDKIVESEAFGQRGVTISGRSVTALVGGTHARETSRINASAATAQQLALSALEFAGVDLDWGIPDWLVPAGAWSHTGTPLAAVQAVVEAAGGYLQSHRTLPTLLARHPYPDLPGGMVGAPWNWENASFAADVALAPDALMVTGIEHVDGAEINGVYVSGVSQGVRALYRRSGTADNLLAPMVSDPLIVAPEAARMRGRSIVGAAGAKHLVSVELPVLTGPGQPGVLDVGQLVQINDAAQPWRGMVRSVRAGAKFGEKVRQSVQIERHLEQV